MITLARKPDYKKFRALMKLDGHFDISESKNPETICVITTKVEHEGNIHGSVGETKAGKKFRRFLAEYESFETFLFPTAYRSEIKDRLDSFQPNKKIGGLENEVYDKGRGRVVVIPPDFLKKTVHERKFFYTAILDPFHWGRSYMVSSMIAKDMISLVGIALMARMNLRVLPYAESPMKELRLSDLKSKINSGNDVKALSKKYGKVNLVMSHIEIAQLICRYLNIKLKPFGGEKLYIVSYVEPPEKKRRKE